MPIFANYAQKMGILAILTLMGTMLLVGTASAVPSWGDDFILQQPDGTKVSVKIWGDEYYRVVESAEGYTLVRDPDTSEICFAYVSPDGTALESSGVRFDLAYGENLGIKKHLRIDESISQKIIDNARAEAQAHDLEVKASLSFKGDRVEPTTIGDVKGITLIIDFSDQPGTIPASNIDDYLNLPGYNGYGNNGSVRDYFYDVSDGLLTYTNYVPTVYYRANNPKSYYDDCNAQYGTRARSLIIEALNHLNSQGFDFSEYDSNDDGIIDALNCFYAGYTDCGWSQGLWPHSSSINWSADGVSTYKYQITGLGTNLSLGTFCHENGHMLCYWPDLYDYDSDSKGVGRFCLMCAVSSPTNPQEPSAPMKYYADWGNVVALDSYAADLPAPSDVSTFYKYDHPTKYYEYYLIENRQLSGRDSGLPDSGLAIWHVDSIYGNNSYQDQTLSRHYEVALIQADGEWDMENDINNGDNADLFSWPDNVECGPETVPNTDWWARVPSSLLITEISPSQATMTFTFNPAGESFVPSQYPTIQAAIDASVNGETIVLADGTYSGLGNVDLDTQGKIITIRATNSEPYSSIIDCGGSAGDPHRAFLFNSAEGVDTRIEGITIINGFAVGDGGAILCDGASPTLSGLYFSENEATGSGGAVAVGSGDNPVVQSCVFADNMAVNGGGFAATDAFVNLSGGTFYSNSAAHGAALACLGSGAISVTNTLITNSLTSGPAYCQSVDSSIVLECSNVYNNLDGDWVDCLSGQETNPGNFSLNPSYCDAENGDLALHEDSPCVAGGHPEGASSCSGESIGALGAGCLAEIFTAIATGPTAHAGDGQGAAWGDFDNDGDDDLFLANYNEPDVLLRNDGGDVFTDVTTAPLNNSGPSTGVAWADFDNDGDLDLYVSQYGVANHLYRNDGLDGFFDVTSPSLDNADNGMGVNWVDFNNDGNVDVYLVNHDAENLLIKNYGDLGGGNWFFFSTSYPVLQNSGGGSGACWGDFDNDGDQDVYLVNQGSNVLVENGGDFGFLDITNDLGGPNFGTSSGAAWGDMNNDSRLDFYVTNDGQADELWKNGSVSFSMILGDPLGSTGAGKGIAWGDYDNDGRLDFLLASDGAPVQLYRNNGDNVFATLAVPEGDGSNRCVTWCDYDQDGDLDAYITKQGANILLRNDFVNNNSWFQVRLEGDVSNRSAIGARVRVVSNGMSQIREITAGSGYLGMNSLTAEFGLGSATMVDSLIINWPSGETDVRVNVSADQLIDAVENEDVSGVDDIIMPERFALHGNVPNPFNPSTTIRYELPKMSVVSLNVYDLGGRLVRRLRSGETESAGMHQAVWNGRDERDHGVASGTYFYRLEAAGSSATHRMVLVK